MSIGVEQVQPLCNVECLNCNCKFHLESRYYFGCNFKHIMISEKGKCLKYKKIPPEIKKKSDRNKTKIESMATNISNMAEYHREHYKNTMKIAKIICEDRGYNPNDLEPGNLPTTDGICPNGDQGHYRWRDFVPLAKKIIKML